MSRSVSRPSNAAVIAYAHVESDPDDHDGELAREQWDDYMVNLSAALRAKFPSLVSCNRWLGREDRVILHNNLAAVTVSEYCGLVAVCLVPEWVPSGGSVRDAYHDDPRSLHWCAQVERRFRRVVADVFGIELRHIATASNGEAFFKRVGA